MEDFNELLEKKLTKLTIGDGHKMQVNLSDGSFFLYMLERVSQHIGMVILLHSPLDTNYSTTCTDPAQTLTPGPIKGE